MESDEPDVFAALMKAGRIKNDGGKLVVISADAARSDPPTIDRGIARNAALNANSAFGQWMPERWLNIFMDSYDDIAECEFRAHRASLGGFGVGDVHLMGDSKSVAAAQEWFHEAEKAPAMYAEIKRLKELSDEIEGRRRRLEDVSCSQQTHISHLHDHIRALIDEDPSEPIADNGMTVLDGWCERALILLRGR